MIKTYKLDIYELLKNIYAGNIDYYQSLTDDIKKEFKPYIVYQWLSNTPSKDYIKQLYNRVDPFMYLYPKHPELIYKLMCSCSDGNTHKPTWVASNKPSHKYKVKLLSLYYEISEDIAEEYIALTPDSICLEMMKELNLDSNFLTNLKKELSP